MWRHGTLTRAIKWNCDRYHCPNRDAKRIKQGMPADKIPDDTCLYAQQS